MKLTPEFSVFLTDIYNIAMEEPLNTFKEKAIQRLNLFISFDCAVWVTRSELESHYYGDETFTYNIPDGAMENSHKLLEASQEVQMMGQILFANLNTTMDLHELTPNKPWHEADLYLRHAIKYNQENGLITMMHHPVNKILNTISINRGVKGGEFTPEEKAKKQFVTPHIIEAFRINILNSFSKKEQNNNSFRAVVDKHGQFIEAEDGFIALLNQFKLIEDNQVDLASIQSINNSQLQITTHNLEGDGLHYLEATDLREKQQITERKKQICRLLARGLSDKEIARELYVTPVTVSKHLQDIKKIFNVNSRYQAIAHILKQQWYELNREH